MIITKLHCKNCSRYLAQAINNVQIDELICAKCKHRNSFKVKVKEKPKEKQDVKKTK